MPESRRWGTAASRSVPTITPVPAACRIPSPPSPVRCAFTSADPCHVCRRFGERRVTPRGSPHVGWCYLTGAASCCCVVSPINSARATADKCANRCRCQRLQHATARASTPRDPSPAPGERVEGVRGRLLQAGGPLDTGRPTDAPKLLSFSGGFEVIAAVARVPQRPAGWPRFSCCPNPRSAHPATGLPVVARLCSADHVGLSLFRGSRSLSLLVVKKGHFSVNRANQNCAEFQAAIRNWVGERGMDLDQGRDLLQLCEPEG